MNGLKITKETIIELHEIEIRKDNKNFIIEDLATKEFYEMPLVCIDALNFISNGFKLGEIEEKLEKAYPDEEIDIVKFGEQLLELNLVHSVDGKIIETQKGQGDNLGFEWIPTRVGKAFFNTYTKYLYGVLFIGNVAIFCFTPSLFPHFMDLFVFDLLSLNILVLGTLSLVLVMIHEFGHILAIRSYNLPTSLNIGHRLYLIVFETDLTMAWKLHPKQRNILYLAGVCFDNVVLFVALILQLFAPIQSEIISGLIGLVVFDVIVRIIYQACIYMKTDFYYYFENKTGTYNLMENSIHMIRNVFSRSKPENKELFQGEEKIVLSYAVFYLVGVVITLGLFFIYYLPQLIYMFINILPGFKASFSESYFWDAVIFTLQMVVLIVLLLYSFSKSLKRKNIKNL